MNPERIAGLLTQRGINPTGALQGRGGVPEWTPEAAAFACAGLPKRHEYAFRFRFALDDSCMRGLRLALLDEAAALHWRYGWPDRFDGRRWLEYLAQATVLIEWLQTRDLPRYSLALERDELHLAGGFSREAWADGIEVCYVRLAQRLDVWCSAASGHIARRARPEDAA